MVPEFDTVVFNEAVGDVHGPVETQFGYHLIEITSRDS
jgi:peptidyl-prolyl cis-trans isomerase C